MSKQMRCYFAGSKYPGDHVYVEACFAYSHREAKALMWREGTELQHECDGNYFDMKVRWHSDFDSMAAKHGITEPCVIRDDGIQRDMGWSIDGDSRCANCNLATWDGEYPLCEHCEQCEECGHHTECQEHGKAGDA